MPVCDTCKKEIGVCACDDRSRSRERKEREKEAEKSNNIKEPVTAVTDLTDLFTRLEARAERREKQTKEDMAKLIGNNDDKWKKRLEEDRKELLRIQDDKTDMKLKQSEAKTNAEFEKIRKKMIVLQKESIHLKESFDSTTVLFGGLQDKTFDAAEKLIKSKLKNKDMEEPSAIYHKGEEFKGIVFAKFTTEKVAENIVKTISTEKDNDGETIWCKKDLPLNKRVPLSFLLGIRKQLITWGFTKSRIRVQEDINTLTVAGQPIMKAAVIGSSLMIDWTSQEWQDWKELVDSSEFKELTKKAEESLRKAEDAKGKGKGKDRP